MRRFGLWHHNMERDDDASTGSSPSAAPGPAPRGADLEVFAAAQGERSPS